MVHDHLTAWLHGEDNASQVIRWASLTGGYIHLLFSATPSEETGELVTTTKDGTLCDNDYGKYALREHLQYLTFCRLRELMQVTLEAININHQNDHLEEALDAFAAAGMLNCEVAHFKGRLLDGKVSDKVRAAQHANHSLLSFRQYFSSRMKDYFVDWFSSIETELEIHLCQNCGGCPDWKKAILGSKKKSRRNGETITLSLSLQRVIHSPREPPSAGSASQSPASSGERGIGKYLSYPSSSPGLTPWDPFCSAPGESEHESIHVSGPLPDLFGTWEETSELPCDLLSQWRHPSIR